jgi:Helicase associated domain
MEVESLHPEWDLMYRKGLPFGLIAKLCKAPRSTVHLHLQRQALLYPQLQAEHERNRAPQVMTHQAVPRIWLEHFEALKAFTEAHGRMPKTRGPEQGENTLAGWLGAQRTEFRKGRIRPEMLELLGTIEAWDVPARTAADRQRWQQRLTDLQVFLDGEHRWPRYRGYRSEEERVLGVWLHIQKQKHRNGDLPDGYAQALTEAAPGWDGNLRHYPAPEPDGAGDPQLVP